MKNKTTESMLEAFQSVYDYLIKKNFKPKLHVIDNECSKVIKTFIENENNVTLQFVESHKHIVNAAERSIQTFKNHFFSGLCTVKNFSLCNFGVNCCNRLKSALTYYYHRAKTQNYRRTLSSKENSTLTKPH